VPSGAIPGAAGFARSAPAGSVGQPDAVSPGRTVADGSSGAPESTIRLCSVTAIDTPLRLTRQLSSAPRWNRRMGVSAVDIQLSGWSARQGRACSDRQCTAVEPQDRLGIVCCGVHRVRGPCRGLREPGPAGRRVRAEPERCMRARPGSGTRQPSCADVDAVAALADRVDAHAVDGPGRTRTAARPRVPRGPWRCSSSAPGCCGASRCRYHSPGRPSGLLVHLYAGPPNTDCPRLGGASARSPRPRLNQNGRMQAQNSTQSPA
jgi:hypothetical protein